jgi:hypothetical protein
MKGSFAPFTRQAAKNILKEDKTLGKKNPVMAAYPL